MGGQCSERSARLCHSHIVARHVGTSRQDYGRGDGHNTTPRPPLKPFVCSHAGSAIGVGYVPCDAAVLTSRSCEDYGIVSLSRRRGEQPRYDADPKPSLNSRKGHREPRWEAHYRREAKEGARDKWVTNWYSVFDNDGGARLLDSQPAGILLLLFSYPLLERVEA